MDEPFNCALTTFTKNQDIGATSWEIN